MGEASHVVWYTTGTVKYSGVESPSRYTTLPAGRGYTTVDLSVSLVRGITERTTLVRCEARVIHVGSSIATAEAKLVDDRGNLCAHGTATCLILTPR